MKLFWHDLGDSDDWIEDGAQPAAKLHSGNNTLKYMVETYTDIFF